MTVSSTPDQRDFSSAQRFISPPLDGKTKNILEVIAYNVEHNPNRPVFQYADADKKLHYVTWIEIANALQSVVQFVGDRCNTTSNSPEPYIIGILANLDSITYFCVIVGIKLAGCVPFPISLRNSADGVAHLLSTTNCRAVFGSEDHRTQDLRSASLQLLAGIRPLTFAVPPLSSLLEPRDHPLPFKLPHNADSRNLCIIYHSTGSTGHPKPIYLTHEVIFKWGVSIAYRDPGIDASTEVVSIHGLPFYHGMVYCLMLSCMMAGTVASVFDPFQDLIFPSPESVIDAAVAANSNGMFTLPSFLEAWSKNSQHVEALTKFKSIMFSGGPMPYEVGETLFQKGVPLFPQYGTTETGPLGVFLRTNLQSVGWNWLKTRPGLDLAFIHLDDGLYKLIVKENELRKLAVSNTTIDGRSAYDTADIVARHPNDSTLWKVIGRQDTIIVHSSGEKTNPIPMEQCLQRDERIAAAVMFGREQLLAGVIILPAEGCNFDTADPTKVKEYCDTIWDTVQKANAEAPGHSRIFKEMIIVASSRRPFEYSDKGFPKRHSILKEYHEEIQKLYIEADSGMAIDNYNVSIDMDNNKHFIRSIVSLTLSRNIGDDDNIFSYGADSLCAMSIRNMIMRVLSGKQPSPSADKTKFYLSPDLLFAHPTINSLSSFISSLPIWAEIKESFLNQKGESTAAGIDLMLPVWSRHVEDMRAPSGMVKFKEGSGEIPLILIPDIGGSSGIFKASQEMYKSAVWSADRTHVPPTKFESVHDLASFYLKQIKSERPVGPYRLASFSGSSVILVYLVKLLEQSGDNVVQVGFMDHFPTAYLHGVSDPATFNPNILAADLDDYVRNNLRHILKMVSVAKEHATLPERIASITYFIDGLEATLDNRPVHPLMEDTIKRMKNTISICIKFLFGDEFRSDGVWSRDLYISWLKSMKAVPTVYLCSDGVCAYCEAPEMEFASGLGAKEACPSARVVVIPGDHAAVLSSKLTIDDLDRDFA